MEPTTTLVLFPLIPWLMSHALEYGMRPGQILSGWLDYWAWKWHRKNDTPTVNSVLKDMEFEGVTEITAEEREDLLDDCEWWAIKPLGYCPICMNLWLSAFACGVFYTVYAVLYGLPGEIALYAIIAPFMSNFLFRLFVDRIK